MILFLLMVITASRDEDYVIVEVPLNWEHVVVSTQPPAEFVEREPGTWVGLTKANGGDVTGAICDDNTCEIVGQRFRVPGGLPVYMMWLAQATVVAWLVVRYFSYKRRLRC